jgi:hypothetical protein
MSETRILLSVYPYTNYVNDRSFSNLRRMINIYSEAGRLIDQGRDRYGTHAIYVPNDTIEKG